MYADHPGGCDLVPREPGRHVAVPRHQLAAAELLVVDLGSDEDDQSHHDEDYDYVLTIFQIYQIE